MKAKVYKNAEIIKPKMPFINKNFRRKWPARKICGAHSTGKVTSTRQKNYFLLFLSTNISNNMVYFFPSQSYDIDSFSRLKTFCGDRILGFPLETQRAKIRGNFQKILQKCDLLEPFFLTEN